MVSMPIVASAFRPHPLLANAHVQTILPALLRPTPSLALRIERWELDDGDYVDIGWGGEAHAARGTAVLVHGLTGSFESKYLRGAARQLIARGWRVAALQLRGAGAEPNRRTYGYHQGHTVDLRALWRRLRDESPAAALVSLGWSLGANVTLKALAETAAQDGPDRAAVACAPFRLAPCAEKLRSGFARVYQNRLLRDLKAMVERKHGRVPLDGVADLPATRSARDFFEYDDAFTAMVNGFADARDYYARCECGQFLGAISTPTLIVNARDDPFMTPAMLPQAHELSASVTLELSEGGGHVGFIGTGRFGVPMFWLDRRLAAWVGDAGPGNSA